MRIPFNKPYLTGNELSYIRDAVATGHISGNGKYTQKCQRFFEERYGIKKALLTTSCTDALEMCAMLLDIKAGDEVIVPSYTFVSTALAFVRQGAKIVFVDSREDHPGMNENLIEQAITNKTKVIVPVHYAGVACNMGKIMQIAKKHNLFVVEDAAQAIESFYIDENGDKFPLGSLGHLATFSFHETKNVQCGEGGLLAINDERFVDRAETIWEKGTNRAKFFRGEVNKYGWVDIGSSFLPSEITASFLWAQLENLEDIQLKRVSIWEKYNSSLKNWAENNAISLPIIPSYATNNGHMYYLICKSLKHRTDFIRKLKENEVHAVFHYLSLHKSKFYAKFSEGQNLIQSDRFTDKLIRLPFYYELVQSDVLEPILNMETKN